jgi:hypothetical protein
MEGVRGSNPSAPPGNTRSEPLCESRQLAAGAKVQAFGMAEAEAETKRRGYGEDGIYFDHRADCRDSTHHKTCSGR